MNDFKKGLIDWYALPTHEQTWVNFSGQPGRTGGSKPATLSTGAVVKVPLFVSEGEIVTIDTRNGEYQGRK